MKRQNFGPTRALARRTPLSAACALIGTLAAAAQAAEPAPVPAETLSEVVVTATRTAERAEDVPATITARDARQIERSHPTDEAALFEDEPDVDVSRDRRRFGAGSINIRGIEDNRVLQMVDGVRLPDYYNLGGPSNISTATRDAPEFSFLKRVEVLRGPASSLYGSDAIGGVVTYATKDPVDLMRGRSMGGEAGLDWNGADNGFRQTAGIAGGNDTVQAMFMYAHRKSQEMKNQGEDDSVSTGRTKPNPQDVETNAWLGKFVYNMSQEQRFKFTYEHRDADSYTDILRLSTSLPRVTAAEGDEGQSRERVSLDYEWTPIDGLLDRLAAQIYYQTSASDTWTGQTRSDTSASCSASTKGTNLCKVDLAFNFKQEEQGINLQADKSFATGSVEHHLIGGIDYLQIRSSEQRDGLVQNLTTGTSTKTLAGETFPIHDFPTGMTRQTGLYIQDELRYGSFSVTPGVRFDHYSLGPDDDATYERVAGREPVGKSDSAVSPKLAALWRATDRINLWAQYVFGFRAPNYREVNGAFMNPVQGYGAAPNPDLKAEKSRSFEIGARYGTETLQTSVTLFDNRYKDFIDQVQLDCPSDPSCLTGLRATYQNRNVDKVRIYGAEWRGVWRFLPQWRIDGAIAYAHGDNEDTDQPINTVSPTRASAGLGWEMEQGRGAEVRWRGARPVTRTDDTQGTVYFKPSGYGVLDLNGWWKVNDYASVQLSIDNVFDQKYWLWGDVRTTGVAATDPGLDFYTQPGRTFAASVKLTF